MSIELSAYIGISFYNIEKMNKSTLDRKQDFQLAMKFKKFEVSLLIAIQWEKN